MMTHKELCQLAVKWLRRPNSQKGHGCEIAVSEASSGWDGECPDAIGFKMQRIVKSVLVEVKTSRADFLADKNKPHRNGTVQALGNWRYYMCPTDIIQPEELPEKFGLLYVNKRGHIKHIVSPFINTGGYSYAHQWMSDNFQETNLFREVFLLARLLRRFPDIEAHNQKYREACNQRQMALNHVDTLREQIRKERFARLMSENTTDAMYEAVPEVLRAFFAYSCQQPPATDLETHIDGFASYAKEAELLKT